MIRNSLSMLFLHTRYAFSAYVTI